MIHFEKPKRKVVIIGSVITMLVAVGLSIGVYQSRLLHAELESVAPNFNPMLPINTSIEQLGGWQKLTPPEGDPSYVFVDSIGSAPINVSQQPLPKDLLVNPYKHVADVAKSFRANTKLKADDTIVYTGSSADGPQWVIFTKNGLLILIRSWSPINDSDWITYIKALELAPKH